MLILIYIFGRVLIVNSRCYGRCYVKKLLPLCIFLKFYTHVAKTELMIIGSRQRLNAQCEEIDISIDDRTIKRVDHTKSLGLTIDAQLSWPKHVNEISKKVSSAIGALKRVRPFIPMDVAVQIYNALILPHFDYCSPVWDGLSGCLSDKLQK